MDDMQTVEERWSEEEAEGADGLVDTTVEMTVRVTRSVRDFILEQVARKGQDHPIVLSDVSHREQGIQQDFPIWFKLDGEWL